MKKIYLFVIVLLLPWVAFSQTDDDNVIITQSTELYDFKIEKDSVVIIETEETTFTATKTRDVIPYSKHFDSYSKIEKASVSGVFGVKPTYRHSFSDEIFYSDDKICLFSLPFDKKDKSLTVNFRKKYLDPHYFGIINFSDAYFIKSKVVVISVPEWMNIDIVEKNLGKNIEKAISTDPKTKTTKYTYTITDQKAMKAENNIQPFGYIYPHILVRPKSATMKGETVKYLDTMDDLYGYYKKVLGMMVTEDDVIKNKALEITANAKTDLDKINALYQWMQENIRYFAFEDGLAGIKPDNPQDVLRKKFGDCKGKSNLLKEMLAACGFDARLTWMGTKHRVFDYSTPSMFVDNHVICTLIHDGKTYFMDPTHEYISLNESYNSIQGREVLIENGDSFIINKIPDISPQENTDSIYAEYKIEENKLVGKVENIYTGDLKHMIREAYHTTAKDRVDLLFKNIFGENNVLDQISDLTITEEKPSPNPVKITFNSINESNIQALSNEYYIGLDNNTDFLKRKVDIDKRVNNYLLPYKSHIVRNIVLHVPKDYKATYIPENFKLSNDKYDFSIQYSENADKIVYKKIITVKDPLIPKTDFEQWNQDIASLQKAFLEQIVLTKK